MKNQNCLLFFILISFQVSGQEWQESVSFEIRNTLENQFLDERVILQQIPLYSSETMLRFYTNRAFDPAWFEQGKLTCNAYEMRYQIQQSFFDGLVPEDYHLGIINDYFETLEKDQDEYTVKQQANLDIFLTDAYIMLSTHLFTGKLNPDEMAANWNIQRKNSNLLIDPRLEEAIQGNKIKTSLQELWPSFRIYPRMRESLREFHEINKKEKPKWNKLTVEKSLKPGERNPILHQIRERLIFWGDLEPYEAPDLNQYDSILLSGVQRLQVRNGLLPDGVLGAGTLEALNKSPQDLMGQVAVNLERLRWLPDSLKFDKLILVNIANFQMDYLKDRDTLLTSNAIVGKDYRATPVFDARMSYLVFSPTWTVPPTILANDVIPAVKRDLGYLAAKKMRILTHSGVEVDPKSIDWSKITARNFPYMVRQDPGQQNSLGLVKFMFPNKYNVYIHDTPTRSLFSRDNRALSSGCIRIEKPIEFAKLLLEEFPQWDEEAIKKAMNSGKERTVNLKESIPVVILYLTFWTDGKNEMHVRNDLYKRDGRILAELYKTRN
ncbi:L,D-transpeptidase family protein [Pararhodonellum marinum]|uniref:L,D-transpeptidase family protein n=1 Tax=Pararhodonellum marinum TaxID=2755358 RepID=UPI00188F2EBC|nr:L,D-transpeptidase family protein [Pararhodonellum marinum]